MTISQCFLLVVFVFLLTGCGARTDPNYGRFGNVLVEDIPSGEYTTAEMSIGFNSNDEFQKLKALVPDANTANEVYIHGLVVADSSYPLGFYLDPATTNIPANFAPEMQYSMRQITDNLENWKEQKVYVVLHVRVERYL